MQLMTTELLGTVSWLLAALVEPVLVYDPALWVVSGVDQLSRLLVKTMIAAWAMLGLEEKSSVGSLSLPVWSLYQQPTFMEPVPFPADVEPSAASKISVQPLTCAVIAKSFHDANKNILSPVVAPAGIATEPSAVNSVQAALTALKEMANGHLR